MAIHPHLHDYPQRHQQTNPDDIPPITKKQLWPVSTFRSATSTPDDTPIRPISPICLVSPALLTPVLCHKYMYHIVLLHLLC